MVSSVSSFNPTTYLSQLKSTKPVTAVANTFVSKPATPAPNPNSTSKPASLTSQSNLLGLSSDVLSALQGSTSSSARGSLLSELVNSSSSSNNPVSGVLGSFLQQSTGTSPIQTAIAASRAKQPTANNSVQNLINSYNARGNANNATLISNAQKVLDQGTSLLA